MFALPNITHKSNENVDQHKIQNQNRLENKWKKSRRKKKIEKVLAAAVVVAFCSAAFRFHLSLFMLFLVCLKINEVFHHLKLNFMLAKEPKTHLKHESD